MSVAFRRESDDEHLEPKFELPIPLGPNLVTARGMDLIQTQIGALAAELAEAEGEEAAKAIKRRLRYWNTRQATAVLAPIPSGDVVEFGCRVALIFKGAERNITLVGDDEADPGKGLLSFSAPLARAIMGGEVGDVIPFADQEDAIEIVGIAPL
jgi:transcription elongation GreA/GreB family factor